MWYIVNIINSNEFKVMRFKNGKEAMEWANNYTHYNPLSKLKVFPSYEDFADFLNN